MAGEELPVELAAALEASPEAAERWQALTPLQRRDQIAYVGGAVREETRRRRAERCVETLLRSARSGTRRGAPLARLPVVIRGTDLPGRDCGHEADGRPCRDVHVGLIRARQVVDHVPGDADGAEWRLELEVYRDAGGVLDFGGPAVRGPRTERHLGLAWQARDRPGAPFRTFRGLKLQLADVPVELVEAAVRDGGTLVATVSLTDERGLPRCATVRPPVLTWT